MYSDSNSGLGFIIVLIVIVLLYLFLKFCQIYSHIIKEKDPERYENAISDLKRSSSDKTGKTTVAQNTNTSYNLRVTNTVTRSVARQRDHNLADESIYKIYGYSVGKQEDLTARQRQNILRGMIEKGVVSRSEAISFLEWNIRLRSNNSNFRVAIKKWNEDIDYLRRM